MPVPSYTYIASYMDIASTYATRDTPEHKEYCNGQ